MSYRHDAKADTLFDVRIFTTFPGLTESNYTQTEDVDLGAFFARLARRWLLLLGLLAAGAAWVVGKTALGLRSDYLAIATLGLIARSLTITSETPTTSGDCCEFSSGP